MGAGCVSGVAFKTFLRDYMKKISVCMFTSHFHPHYSGAAKQAVSLAKEMRNLGVHSFFITVDNGKLNRHEKFDGFDVYRINEGRGKIKEIVLWFNLFCILFNKRKEYDIIHSHGAYYKNSIIGLIGKLLKKGTVAKISMSNNDLSGMEHGFYGRIHNKLFNMFDSCISISPEISAELSRLVLSHKRIKELSNGVDSDKFKPVSQEHKEQLRQKLKLPSGVIFLYVGGISERKNVEWLVKTWSDIFRETPDVSLVLVGPASREDSRRTLINSLIDYAAKNSFTRKVFFREYTDAIEKYFQAADIFILPSKNEGMPNVLIEAMSCGLACMATRVSGASKLIIDGKTGLFFDTGADGDFRDKAVFLTDNNTERERLGITARSLIMDKFCLKKIGREYISIYSDLMMLKPSRF